MIPNPDSTGYVKYYAVDSLRADTELFTQNDLFYVDAGIYGGASENATGGCNIDFGTFLDIDWNLDALQFEVGPAPFDASLFDKADAISSEVAIINDMLINSILDMGCCDIAQVYNTTLVPFFQFFADNPDGGENLISVLIKYSEIITALRAIVEPLDCLTRFVPNNPWLPKDVDPLAWIYGYFKETSPVLNRIMSGELLDLVLNPVHSMRTKLQACLYNSSAQYNNITEIGSAQQLEAISALAVKNGGTIIDYSPPPMDKPLKPNTNDPEELARYEDNLKKYEFYVARQKTILEEKKRQSVQIENINQHLGVSAVTKNIIKVHTNGLCGCLADAFGMRETTIENIAFRTTSDLNTLVGKTHANATYGDIGAITKDTPKDKKVTVEKKHISNVVTKTKIVEKTNPTGSQGKKITKEVQKKEWKNPYCNIDYGPAVLEETVEYLKTLGGSYDACDKLEENDKTEIEIKALEQSAKALEQKKAAINNDLYKKWSDDKMLVEKILEDARKEILGITPTTPEENNILKKKQIEYDVATKIYNSYFGTFRPFDFENDPDDYSIISQYLPDLSNSWMYPPEYWDISSTVFGGSSLTKLSNTDINKLSSIDYNNPDSLDGIISRLPIATEVSVDERFYTNYFNSGFVREGGSSSWRDFNPLNVSYDAFCSKGAIARNKSQPIYTAIFPNDTIGNDANILYIKEKYIPTTFLKTVVEEELIEPDSTFIDNVLNTLEIKYGYTWEQHIAEFNDEELLKIIKEISIANGYKPGKLWVKTQLADPSVLFEYTYEDNNVNLKIDNIPISVSTLTNNVADEVAQKTNTSIQERGGFYVEASKTEVQRQAIGQNIDTARYAIMNSIAGLFPAEMDIMIPCTCDNFLCQLLNYVIQYLMGTVNKLTEELLSMIANYLIPDWVKSLINTLQEFLGCLGSVFGIANTISEIDQYSKDLLESLRGRISLYPADPCFLPSDPFEEPVIEEPGVGEDGSNAENPVWDSPDLPPRTYYPPGSNEQTDDGYYPPPVIFEPVTPGTGDPGNHYPAFIFKCDYLWL